MFVCVCGESEREIETYTETGRAIEAKRYANIETNFYKLRSKRILMSLLANLDVNGMNLLSKRQLIKNIYGSIADKKEVIFLHQITVIQVVASFVNLKTLITFIVSDGQIIQTNIGKCK